MSNETVKLTFKTRILCLTLFLGTGVCIAQAGRNLSSARQKKVTPVGSQCPDGETNQPRPSVKLYLGDVTKKALELPQPEYPQKAKAAGVSGIVKVEVVIDINSGRVVWARVLNGHPLLQEAVRNVMCRVRFTHTNDVDGRASGIVTFRFGRRR